MIKVRDLSFEFRIGKRGKEKQIPVLKEISLDVKKGEIVTLVGRSGSGKSTLLHLLSGYLHPTKGRIEINGTPVEKFSEKQWADFRLQNIGFIFQNFQLIPSMTAFKNVELPLVLKGVPEKERQSRVHQMFTQVGLEDFLDYYPSELSGGQQQRISIARALVMNPPLLLADEPTGSLDSETEADLLNLIQSLNRDKGITFLIITHDQNVAKIGHRTLVLKDGKLAQEENYAFTG
ncbi:ABC transporter ATP-binding protein YtrE [Collibacillus ludicampi]|uniref:ABC transporter ATP-binding protein YtrE n=1 Tax=Collibacillus ludicampi TaxID=2771369 RepID=A0AAV4LGB0_9BACL|nr:ABC transporter ATP-binding protein [Collibacillus ludicampi]GIM46855.1 ABC transporter ATP-binding protein YtrE [Collibacillus ludicampi]